MSASPTIARRVLVIGLDCAPPALVFDRFRHVMPTVASLMDRGAWGPLRSTTPPITVPAWISMTTGRTPGELGLYGFRNRERGDYAPHIPDARALRHKRVWDWIGESGKRVAPLFVPFTYPPPPVNGVSVSCFMTPDGATHTFPPTFGKKLDRFGPYISDVTGFRNGDPHRILRDLYAMTEQHFDMAKYVWETEVPDFMMMVDMGPDRFHHAFWNHFDPAHPQYTEGEFAQEGERYYRFLDEQIAKLVKGLGDDAAVLVVSDHGARPLMGGMRINEWLRRRGWLTLKSEPTNTAPLELDNVDWSTTRAWALGGYYSRVWLNMKGREPQGIVEPDEYESTLEGLRQEFNDQSDVPARTERPRDLYPKQRGLPPDLFVFYDDLAFRALSSVGPGPLVTEENDTGVDGCNHDWDGVFVMAGAGVGARGPLEGLHITDVASTIAALMQVPVPGDLAGKDRSQA